jgi:putative transposase
MMDILVSIKHKISISSFTDYLKAKSDLIIFDKFANLKYKFENRHLVAEVSFNKKHIKEQKTLYST